MKVLSLDISMKNTGWAIFENDKLLEYGSVLEQRYPGCYKDVYPKRSAKIAKLMSIELAKLVEEKNPEFIVIEEVSQGGIAGVKSIKGLIQVHGMLLFQIEDRLDTVTMMPPQGKDGWRTYLGIKMNGDWKKSAVVRVNRDFMPDTKLTLEQNDIAEAILLGHCFILKKVSGWFDKIKKE